MKLTILQDKDVTAKAKAEAKRARKNALRRRNMNRQLATDPVLIAVVSRAWRAVRKIKE